MYRRLDSLAGGDAAAAQELFTRSALFAMAAVVIVFASGCGRGTASTSQVAFPTEPSGQLDIAYPFDGSLFPPDIAAPTFAWTDSTAAAEQWTVLLRYGNDDVERYPVTEPQWQPSAEQWEIIKQQTQAGQAQVAIMGLGPDARPVSSATVSFGTSTDPVGDAIFYREVPLPFIAAVQDPSRIRWRYGSVASEAQPPVVLENLPVCGNCHSFSGDGGVLGLDVDYGNDKGGYAILPVSQQMVLNDEKIITWSDYEKDDGEATFGLLSQVSPDGRYVISTVKDRAVFVATPGIEYSQLFFPIKGILVVYDTQTGTYTPLPGADDPDYVQSNPTWSPDGQYVVFARSKVYSKPGIADATSILLSERDVPEFIEDKEPFKFDLYRVPFNEGRGGTPEPIEGASHNGKSNFFAKYSPDGKWIVFCKAENYMLLMPDSELFIVPAQGGEARRLRANTSNMNSWHSFSSNGRWLVFSSKEFTPYTQLFLTHIDEEGHSSPPVVLDRFTSTQGAANIPEFVPLAADSIAQIKEQFLDAYSFLRAGMANERTGNYPGAVRSYQRGLAVAPDNVELLNALGFSYFQQGKSDEAVVALEKALALDPKHAKAHNNMALASIDIGLLELAEAHYRESLAIEPHPAIYNDLGYVLERLGLPDEAAEQYRQALELDAESAPAHFNLASSMLRAGEAKQAEQHFRAAVEHEPDTRSFTGLGIALGQQGRINEAIASYRRAIDEDPKNAAAYDQLGDILVQGGKLEEALLVYQNLVQQQPSAAAHLELAGVLERLGRVDEARRQTTIAARLQQN